MRGTNCGVFGPPAFSYPATVEYAVMSSRCGPRLVGLAGGSCSGKSTLARALADAADGVVLPQDAYYRDLSELTPNARQRWNFDTPAAFDWDSFATDLARLADGAAVHTPVYDYTNHTRADRTRLVTPRSLVVVEGLLVFHDERTRALFDLTVFLDVHKDTALARRVARDREERGRDATEVRERFARDTQPMFKRWVEPTRRWAMLQLSGTLPVAELVASVRERLAQSSE